MESIENLQYFFYRIEAGIVSYDDQCPNDCLTCDFLDKNSFCIVYQETMRVGHCRFCKEKWLLDLFNMGCYECYDSMCPECAVLCPNCRNFFCPNCINDHLEKCVNLTKNYRKMVKIIEDSNLPKKIKQFVMKSISIEKFRKEIIEREFK